jgi:hypothetical protein
MIYACLPGTSEPKVCWGSTMLTCYEHTHYIYYAQKNIYKIPSSIVTTLNCKKHKVGTMVSPGSR